MVSGNKKNRNSSQSFKKISRTARRRLTIPLDGLELLVALPERRTVVRSDEEEIRKSAKASANESAVHTPWSRRTPPVSEASPSREHAVLLLLFASRSSIAATFLRSEDVCRFLRPGKGNLGSSHTGVEQPRVGHGEHEKLSWANVLARLPIAFRALSRFIIGWRK